MPRTLTNDQLADKLTESHPEAPFLAEAARRLRSYDLRHLLTVVDMVHAVMIEPRVDEQATLVVEKLITSIPLSSRELTPIRSLAERIFKGHPYTDREVRELAVYIMARDGYAQG